MVSTIVYISNDEFVPGKWVKFCNSNGQPIYILSSDKTMFRPAIYFVLKQTDTDSGRKFILVDPNEKNRLIEWHPKLCKLDSQFVPLYHKIQHIPETDIEAIFRRSYAAIQQRIQKLEQNNE